MPSGKLDLVRLENDFQSVVDRVQPTWAQLRDRNILITGGTGFFGKWLVETFLRANSILGLNATAWIVSRDPQRALTANPNWKKESALQWIQGDVTRFEFPQDRFSHVIHAATDVFQTTNDPAKTIEVGTAGTARVIEFCKAKGVESLLLTSSGAVYGRQPLDIDRVPETYLGPQALEPGASAYALGKRLSEWLVLNSPSLGATRVSIARCFAFAGPLFPLDGPFALTDFTSRLLKDESISINGDGTALRSYMDGTDLTTWLWKLLFDGPDRTPVNVGSDDAVSIQELADYLVTLSGKQTNVSVAKRPMGTPPERYVPSIEKARSLGLDLKFDSREAIRRTFEFHRNQG